MGSIIIAFPSPVHLLVSKLARRGSKVVEKSSENTDLSASEGAVTDVHFAADLIQESFPVHTGRNVGAAIGHAFKALTDREKKLPKDVLGLRPRRWTERRVRSLWFREARRVDHYEIQDLTAVAVEEARIERQRLKAREDRLAAFLAAHQESVDRQGRYAAGREAVRLDRAGDRADQAGTD